MGPPSHDEPVGGGDDELGRERLQVAGGLELLHLPLGPFDLLAKVLVVGHDLRVVPRGRSNHSGRYGQEDDQLSSGFRLAPPALQNVRQPYTRGALGRVQQGDRPQGRQLRVLAPGACGRAREGVRIALHVVLPSDLVSFNRAATRSAAIRTSSVVENAAAALAPHTGRALISRSAASRVSLLDRRSAPGPRRTHRRAAYARTFRKYGVRSGGASATPPASHLCHGGSLQSRRSSG